MKTIVIGSFFVLLAIVAGMFTSTAFADHTETTIVPVAGSKIPGCELTPEGCWEPMIATVDVGGKVIFINTDQEAAHTFTSGSADKGPSGVFDSSLLVVDKSYEWIATIPGEYPYFCMIHPWMDGILVVVEAGADTMKESETSDGEDDVGLMVDIVTGTANQGESLSIDVTFTIMGESVEHVNYDIKATQNGEVVLDEMAVHDHDGVMNHMTAALPAAASDDAPVEVEVMFNGFGIDEPFTGPIGEVATTQVVPEFGAVAMMILAVAIISIVAVTAKSRVIPRL